MTFREFFIIQEFKLRGVKDLKANPVIPSEIPKTGFRNNGATKMKFWLPPKPYKPIFRMGKSFAK